MNKQINFQATDSLKLNERIIEFFQNAGFKYNNKVSEKLLFYQNDSLLEAWKIDPLKWKSEIIITIQNNVISGEFNVDTEVQMLTYEEEKAWNEFIDDFQNSIQNQNIIPKTLKADHFKQNRKSKFAYFAWLIIGAIIGGLIGSIIGRYSESRILVYLCIPFFATLFLKFRINLVRHQKAL